MDKNAKDLKNNSKILYLNINKFGESCHSWLVLIKARNGGLISNKESVKDRWTKRFENVLNQDKITGNDLKKNKKLVTI